MDEWLATAEMFWVHSGNALGSANGLGLRLAGRWNEQVLHYDDGETGNGIRNVQEAVFATGQSVRPEPGRGRTAACRPVRSFSKVARQVGIKDEDGRHSVVPSRLFLNLPDEKNSGTRTDEIVSSPRPPPSPAVFRCFPSFSAFFRRRLPSPAVPRRRPPPPTVPYHPLQEYVSDRGACRPS